MQFYFSLACKCFISFTNAEFSAFRTIIHSDFMMNGISFPDEVERIMVRTPNDTVNLTFTKEEWGNIKAALDEAQFVQQVYAMMK
ncbi:MAG: hypothetical protein H7259_03825 [Cytophagales bacterium]|nr:hypothetical protein [Cytophaga sp.]